MSLKNNLVDYTSILKKLQPIYNFTLYTPTLTYYDNDPNFDEKCGLEGMLPFLKETNQNFVFCTREMSEMNLNKLEVFFNKYVPNNGFIVEIGVWRNPNGDYTSTELFFDIKDNSCHYLGIDIENRPHILGKRENVHFLQTDSANIVLIKEYIDTHINKEIDFLFIDGWHTIDQVKKELELIKYVKKGGVIALHDISVHSGSHLWMNAFSPDFFDIYKYHENNDWGIGFLVKKF